MGELRGGERGFLLLTSNLGNPDRKPLTVAQFRELTSRFRNAQGQDISRDVQLRDFIAIGYSPGFARHILDLLQDEPLMHRYLTRAEKHHCVPITRATETYPLILRKRLGLDSPGCLWAKGDLSLLDTAGIALVGSRELNPQNRAFAEEVGRQAARQGLTLISGNARGADKAAQNACLQAGGKVISVVADSLTDHRVQPNMLLLSENSFDEGFSAQRALSRNRIIHAMGRTVFVAQSDLGKGGTWDGTVKNLRFGWSCVACFRDGSSASVELEQMGAFLLDITDVRDFGMFPQKEPSLFD